MSKKRLKLTVLEVRGLSALADAREKGGGLGSVGNVRWDGRAQQLGGLLTSLQKKDLVYPNRILCPDGQRRTFFTLSPTALAMTE